MTAERASPASIPVPAAEQPRLALRTQLGRADDLRAELEVEVIVPLGTVPSGAELAVEAALSGPESIRSTTLPVRLPVRFAGLRETPAGRVFTGRVVLTEPAYWTADLPMRYRVAGRLLADGQLLAELAAAIGLRRLGIRGHSLWLDGRRWVPRGIACGLATELGLTDRLTALDAAAVAVVDLPAVTPDDSCLPVWDFLADADRRGRPLLVRLAVGSPGATAEGIARLAQHPAVMAVVLPAELLPAAAEWQRLAGTMLLATEVPGDQSPPAVAPPGIDLLVIRLAPEALPTDGWRVPAALPAVAWQAAVKPTRAACDRLQAALAGWRLAGQRPPADWDWAGFLVG